MHPHFAVIMIAWVALGAVFGALGGALLISNAIAGIGIGIVLGSSIGAAWMALQVINR